MTEKRIADIKFVRRTKLKDDESRCNFRQIDQDAISVITSREARQVTSMMSQVYLCIINAPFKFLVAEGELHFCGEFKDGRQITAWEQLIETLGVADGTALKALKFMHERQVIGYHAGKNGVGIRIFINRAEASIRTKSEPQKNLPEHPVANREARVSAFAIPFRTGTRNDLDNEIRTFAPENGAGSRNGFMTPSDKARPDPLQPTHDPRTAATVKKTEAVGGRLPAEVIDQIAAALAPTFRSIAEREASRQAGRTREWLERYGVPKAARVAQNEAFKIHQHQSKLRESAERARSELAIGNASSLPPIEQAITETGNVHAQTRIAVSEAIEICRTARQFHGTNGSTAALASLLSDGTITHDDAALIRELLGELTNRNPGV